MQKNWIQNMRILEVLIKRKKLITLAKKLNMLLIQKDLSKLDSNETQTAFDATSLYPSALFDENSENPRTENGFAFKLYMNDSYIEAFKNKTFNQDGNESSILRIKNYNPPKFIF